MTNELKNHVAENPQISHVFFNSKGEWQFYPKTGFNKQVSRDEILKMKVASETPDSPATKPQLSTEPGHVSEAAEKKGHVLTDAQKAWLEQMPKDDQNSDFIHPDGPKVKGPDLDGDGQVDGAGSDIKRKVEEKVSKQNDKK